MYCHIRVHGHLDPSWQHRFAGLHVTPEAAGTTLLSGSLSDQAALQGMLLQIVRLGLVLLLLETGEGPDAEEREENAQRTRNDQRATAHGAYALNADEIRGSRDIRDTRDTRERRRREQ